MDCLELRVADRNSVGLRAHASGSERNQRRAVLRLRVGNVFFRIVLLWVLGCWSASALGHHCVANRSALRL